MKDKKVANFIEFLAILLFVMALLICPIQQTKAETLTSDTSSLYWSPNTSWWPWWGEPDLDVHIGTPISTLGGGEYIPVRVHNHWYGTAKNVNVEVYAQKRWIACLNRPPSLRLAEKSFTSIYPADSKTIWVYWDQPKAGQSLYAQVDSGDLLTTGVYGPVPVSPYFRKNDHSGPGIRYTPPGDPLASWHYQDPYQVAIDLVRNVNYPLGQNFEKNEKNNWDYYKRYDANTQPGRPVIIPLPIPNPIPNLTFAGTINVDADSVNNDMLNSVTLGTAQRVTGVAAGTSAYYTTATINDAFVPTPDNVLRFNIPYNKDDPDREFPAAILVKPGETTGTTEFKVIMSLDPQPGTTDEDQEIEIHIGVTIAAED